MQILSTVIAALLPLMSEVSFVPIGAGIAALACAGAGIGQGIAVAKAVEAIARQPEAAGKIRSLLLLGLAFIETTAIYGLLVVILLIFV